MAAVTITRHETPLSFRSSLGPYLSDHWAAQVIAHTLAVLLALASAFMVALAGPVLHVLLEGTSQSALSMSDILGPNLGSLATWMFGVSEVNTVWFIENLAAIIVIVAATRWLVGAGQWFSWERIGEKISYTIRRDLVDRYLHLNPGDRRKELFEKVEGEMAGNFSNDIRLVREYVVHFYGGLPREGLQTVLLAGMLVTLNPRLFLIFLIGVAPAVALVNTWGQKLRRRARAALKDFSDLSEWIQQRFLGIETIKHHCQEAYEISGMGKMTDILTRRFLSAARIKSRTSPVIEACSVVAVAVVVYFAVSDVASGRVQGMTQVSFFATLAVIGQNLSKLGKYVNSNREGRAGCDRIFGSMAALQGCQLRTIGVGGTLSASDVPRLSLDNVWARYPGQSGWAVQAFSVTFESGRTYCLCGPSGAGKTSVLQVLMGALPNELGEITVGLPRGRDRRSAVGYMPQNSPLVPDTILANVLWPQATGDELKARDAIAEVGLLDLLNQLPENGLTKVGEGGRSLSGGQAQRLHLARLRYHSYPILLIDEGTSALDPETEQVVFEMIRKMAKQGAIVVMIAHRLAVTEIADEILFMDRGELICSGSKDIVRANPAFADFVRSTTQG